MTGMEVQAMWEAETAALWEELNKPDPAEKYLEEAAESLKTAAQEADKAVDSVMEAAAALSGWPMQYKLDSIAEALDDLRAEISELAKTYERGERE